MACSKFVRSVLVSVLFFVSCCLSAMSQQPKTPSGRAANVAGAIAVVKQPQIRAGEQLLNRQAVHLNIPNEQSAVCQQLLIDLNQALLAWTYVYDKTLQETDAVAILNAFQAYSRTKFERRIVPMPGIQPPFRDEYYELWNQIGQWDQNLSSRAKRVDLWAKIKLAKDIRCKMLAYLKQWKPKLLNNSQVCKMKLRRY